jgi:hypothetical protein
MIKNTERKVFFNAAANGFTDVLEKMILKNNELLTTCNKDTREIAVYYALKNRHLDSVIFLYNSGQKFSNEQLKRSLISSKNPYISYLFTIKLLKEIDIIFDGKSGQELYDHLFDIFKRVCYNHNDFISLEKILKLKYTNINWGSVLNEYRTYKGIGVHSNSAKAPFF